MDEDYMSFVKSHIELDKILAVTNPKYHEEIKKLLEKKNLVIKKNGLFAGIQLNHINKKIEKIKNKS